MSLFDPSDFVSDAGDNRDDNSSNRDGSKKRQHSDDAPYSPTRAVSDDEEELNRAPVYGGANDSDNSERSENSDDEVVPKPSDSTIDNIAFDILQVSQKHKEDEHDEMLRVPNANRSTRRVMTRFERCNIVGTRAQQLALGAEPLIDPEGEIDPLTIAERELAQFRIPMVIRRFLPDGTYEDWAVQDFNPNNSNQRDSD